MYVGVCTCTIVHMNVCMYACMCVKRRNQNDYHFACIHITNF